MSRPYLSLWDSLALSVGKWPDNSAAPFGSRSGAVRTLDRRCDGEINQQAVLAALATFRAVGALHFNIDLAARLEGADLQQLPAALRVELVLQLHPPRLLAVQQQDDGHPEVEVWQTLHPEAHLERARWQLQLPPDMEPTHAVNVEDFASELLVGHARDVGGVAKPRPTDIPSNILAHKHNRQIDLPGPRFQGVVVVQYRLAQQQALRPLRLEQTLQLCHCAGPPNGLGAEDDRPGHHVHRHKHLVDLAIPNSAFVAGGSGVHGWASVAARGPRATG
mmetsp:Transcript_94438/g.303684  ORF Transcript_94438/g.303684 Transcript_94438/m.303684 type:complete len:277 (-) Transcript_94438:29-859(-)